MTGVVVVWDLLNCPNTTDLRLSCQPTEAVTGVCFTLCNGRVSDMSAPSPALTLLESRTGLFLADSSASIDMTGLGGPDICSAVV